jgi:exopolyphosphatase/guanosine-5'-triphosphate,3'-diphosphate pyrophosphatase
MAGDLRPVRLAGIDIGTNTVLLLVAEVDARGGMTVLAECQEIPRLGRDVDGSGKISGAGIEKLVSVIDRYAVIARSHGAERILACATSAVRDASNREELLDSVREKCGIGQPSILSRSNASRPRWRPASVVAVPATATSV